MGWNAGTYTKGNNATGGWVGDASLGIGIEAGRHDTQDNDFATGINNCLTLDGQNFPTQNLPMNAKKHTNVANASARNEYAAVGQVQDGDFIWLGTAGGTATALTASSSPQFTAYKAGQKFRLITASASTGATQTPHTLQINGIVGAKNIVNNFDATNPTAGTWLSGVAMELLYDGTNFRIINECGGWQDYTPTVQPNTGSASSVVIRTAKWRKINKTVEFIHYVTFNTTSAGQYIELSVPVNWATNANYFLHSAIVGNGSATVGSFITLRTQGLVSYGAGYTAPSWGSITGGAVYYAGFYFAV